MEEKLAKLKAIIEKKKALRDAHQFNFDTLEQQQKDCQMQIDALTNKIAELEAEKDKIRPELECYIADVAELEQAFEDITFVEPVVVKQPEAEEVTAEPVSGINGLAL